MNNNRVTVLACIDGSTFAHSVVDYASWVSRTVGAPLKLLHNIEHRSPMSSDFSGSLGLGEREELLEELVSLEEKRSRIMLAQGKLMLESACQRAGAAGAVEPVKLQRHGSLAETLIELDDETRVLVLGVRGEDHENREHQLGAQLESVIRGMQRPILVVNREYRDAPKRYMVAYDGSEAARKALAMVAESPLYQGLECHLVHVSKERQSPVLDDAAAVLRQAGLSVVTASLHGNVEKQLADYQQQHDIDLVVMGAFGHSRLRELLFGSVTHRMLANASVPLLLLR
jgi:nucleotide-binding universal stress UspA family protein